MRKIQLAIVDDHEMYRTAMIKLFNSQDDLEVIFESENGHDLLLKLQTYTPDIILMDIRMPKMGGFEATEKVSNQYPDIKIIALSQFDYEQNVIEMYVRGVKSFLGKDSDPNELLKAIRIVYGCGVYVTDFAMEIIRKHLCSASKESAKVKALGIELSETESQVLKYVCDGLSSTDIGNLINKSHRTVEKYREELYRKLNVCSKKELIELGLSIIYNRTNR